MAFLLHFTYGCVAVMQLRCNVDLGYLAQWLLMTFWIYDARNVGLRVIWLRLDIR